MNVDPEKTHLLKEFKHNSPLLTCAFDPSGEFVFAGGHDRFVQRWEIATGKKISLEGHETWVCTMAVGKAESPGMLFTGDYAGRVVCWSLDDDLPQMKWTIEAHQGTVRSVVVSPDGKLLATGGKDGKVRLWATDNGKLVKELSGHADQVYCVGFHPSGQLLASADRQSQHPTVRLWDLKNQRETGKFDASVLSAYRRYEDIEWAGVRGVAFSPDGSILACCGRHKYAGPAGVLLFDHREGQQTEKFVSTFKAVFHRIALHPNGFLIAAGGGIKSGELWFWNLKDEQPRPIDKQPEPDKEKSTTATDDKPLAKVELAGPASCFDLHPNSRQIAVAQSLGKSTHPESGMVGIYGMSAQQETEKETGDIRE